MSISLQMEEDGTYSVRELTQEEESTLETEDGVLVIETMLPGRDARVWEIREFSP